MTVAILFVLACIISPVISSPDRVIVRAGNSTQIPCSVTLPAGAVVKSVMWYRGGHLHVSYNPDTKGVKYTGKNAGENSRALISSTLKLDLSETKMADSTDYMCDVFYGTATEPLASHNSTVILVVQDQPGSPQVLNVTAFAARTMSISWSSLIETNNSPIVRYILSIKNASQNWSQAADTRLRADSYSHVVDQLSPYHEYHVTLTAENSIGKSPPSKPVSQRTAQERPSAPPVISQSNSTDSSISLSFLPPPPSP